MKQNNTNPRPVSSSKNQVQKTGLNTKAFTLVELIVVITILAILGTIAFISLQGYSKSSRDSVRISDVSNMKTSLELFHLNAGKYPLPDDSEIVDYGTETLWYQGQFGTNVVSSLSRNLNEIPTDPLTDKKYIYSVAGNKNEFEILNLLEGDIALNTTTQTNAANLIVTPRIDGTYNGVFIKTASYIVPVPSIISSEDITGGLTLTTDNIKSQIINNGENIPNLGNINYNTGALTNLTLNATGTITNDSTDEQKLSVYQAIYDTYTGTTLATDGAIQIILNQTTDEEKIAITKTIVLNNTTTVANTPTYSCTGTVPTSNVTKTNDTGLTADTPWQNTQSGDDCYYECTGGYTGTNCEIAPPLITSTDCTNAGWYWVNETLDTMGNGFCISPRIEANGDTNGIAWQDVGTIHGWTTINYATTEGLSDNLYGVTAHLTSYTCGGLNGGHTDVLDYGDTIAGRMKWISSFANTSNNETELANIDWINITTNNTSYAIPSIYIADCIDGVKDLTTDMTLGAETITWSDYISTVDGNDSASDITRNNRNKYLLGWAKETGSHLPSAYSDISYQIGDNLTGDARGEYQVACDNNTIIGGDLTTDTSNEQIWLSAIGSTTGTFRGRGARIVGHYGCGDQGSGISGSRSGIYSARFVVRP